MNKTRVVLADDHTLMRAGLRVLLEREPDIVVVGEAEDGRQTIDLIDSLRPEVLVLDIAMPNLNGIEAARQIAIKHPEIAIVILSMHSDESYILRALKAGIRAYLLKDSAELDLVRAIRDEVERIAGHQCQCLAAGRGKHVDVGRWHDLCGRDPIAVLSCQRV